MTELTDNDKQRIEQEVESLDYFYGIEKAAFKKGAEYATKYERDDRLSLLVAFGALVQMKEISNLTEAAKHFLWDYDNIKNSLKTK